MKIITLTTDFGYKDPYVAVVKGGIYSEVNHVQIVDISHGISPFHLHETAYVIQNAYQSFPKGSIHIIGVDAELNPENRHIAMYWDGHYFIGADNGILSFLIQEKGADQIVEINIHEKILANSDMDVFIKVAAHIAREGALTTIGREINSIREIKGINPVVSHDNNQIVGNVIYVDNYGNVITNITRSLFKKIAGSREFTIMARSESFEKIYNGYSEFINFNQPFENRSDSGKKLALWNSSGYLELAIYKSNPATVGSASTLFGLYFRDQIYINFKS